MFFRNMLIEMKNSYKEIRKEVLKINTSHQELEKEVKNNPILSKLKKPKTLSMHIDRREILQHFLSEFKQL